MWAPAMARVMVSCPNSGKQVYVGLNLDWSALEALGEEEHSFRCPSCGANHSWRREDADLIADGSGD